MDTRILVIEDEQPVRINIIDILDAEGFMAMGAQDGEAALALLQELEVDLILCDIMMPKLDGMAVLKALKERSPQRVIPLIFLTAKTTHEDIRAGMRLGAWDYLTKPFKHHELLDSVRAQLEKVKTYRALPATASADLNHLRESIHKLEALNAAKDELLNKLIEELRNPLSSINMSITLLKQAKSQQERDRYLQIFQDEYNRELSLLNQFSELQKLLTPETLQLMQQFQMFK